MSCRVAASWATSCIATATRRQSQPGVTTEDRTYPRAGKIARATGRVFCRETCAGRQAHSLILGFLADPVRSLFVVKVVIALLRGRKREAAFAGPLPPPTCDPLRFGRRMSRFCSLGSLFSAEESTAAAIKLRV